MGVGAPANARDIIYDPFFGNDGELVTAATDGRVYTPATAGATLTRQSGHVVPSVATVWTIDPAPQFNTDVDVTGVFLLSASLGENRVYGRYTSISSCYFASWNVTTNFFQVGYRDGSGAHTLTFVAPSVAGVAGAAHTIRLVCKGTSIQGTLDGAHGVSATDTRYTSGQVGFQLFQTDNYLESFTCLRG